MSEVIVDIGEIVHAPAEPDLRELYDAIAKAQGMFRAPRRTKPVTVRMKSGGTYSFSYAPLDEILDAIKEGMAVNGLSHRQYLARHESHTVLRTVIRHSSGQHEESDYPIFPTDEGGQGFASGVTYARRQGLSLALGLAPEDDDDGNAAEGNEITRHEKKPEPPRSIPRMPPEAEKPYAPEMPHLIQFPQLQSGGPDYRRFGSALMTALRAEKAQQPWREWQIANADQLDRMKEKEPAQYDKLIQAIDRDGDRFRDMVAAEEAGNVIA